MPFVRNAFRVLFCFSFAAAILFQTPAYGGGNPKEGKKTYDDICSSCHGEDGTTEVPGIPLFAEGERFGKTDAQLANSIKNGVNNPDNPSGMSMPPYGGGPRLSDNEIADVVSYIRTLKKKK